MKRANWKKYGFEFLSIFVAVIAAFALNNWNDNQRNATIENKILVEIANGLEKDIEDINVNVQGHEAGIEACRYWRRAISGQEVNADSVMIHYLGLTRDFISIQNVSGYEALKSKGLELLKNDALRFEIISLYEYDYQTLKKFEEEYREMQYQDNYFMAINNVLAPNFTFDETGNIIGMRTPFELSESERKIVLSYLWKIQANRRFILYFYTQTTQKVNTLRAHVEKELAE
ncbi:hypothetical protein [Lewinella sp. LCG006]|uniref:hypothetical protein n=1 Tax=Lewinella sp. LCG006 TaxID=3231911 RepID=UPI00345F50E2